VCRFRRRAVPPRGRSIWSGRRFCEPGQHCWQIRPTVRMVMEGVTPPASAGGFCRLVSHRCPKAPRGSEGVTLAKVLGVVGRFAQRSGW
jgi:hypothetical protein